MASGKVRATLTPLGGTPLPIGFSSPGVGSASFETHDLDLGDDHHDKMIDSLVFGFDPGELPSLQVSLGVRQRFSQEIEWFGPYSLEGIDNAVFPDVPETRYVRLLVEDLAPVRAWKLTQIDFYGRLVGGRV